MSRTLPATRLLPPHGMRSDDTLQHFFLEERYRRSAALTGFLVSGAGAGAVACWFAVGNLYAAHVFDLILRLLVIASGMMLAAVVIGFLAALAGYKAFEIAAGMPLEQFGGQNRADRWVMRTNVIRAVAAFLVACGGLTAFVAYVILAWA